MAIINLTCKQCGGAIKLDSSREIGTCESCFSQFVVKEDKIVQEITQNITKHVYGYQGKDVEELVADGDELRTMGDVDKANAKYRRAIDIDPKCWVAWLMYSETGGDRNDVIGMVPALHRAYQTATNEGQEAITFRKASEWIPNTGIYSAYVRAYNQASSRSERTEMFFKVCGVIGRDDTEMAQLAVDLLPNDWQARLELAKVRQIRAKWQEPKGLLRKWPPEAEKVMQLFQQAYDCAKATGPEATAAFSQYIQGLKKESGYKKLADELMKRLGI